MTKKKDPVPSVGETEGPFTRVKKRGMGLDEFLRVNGIALPVPILPAFRTQKADYYPVVLLGKEKRK